MRPASRERGRCHDRADRVQTCYRPNSRASSRRRIRRTTTRSEEHTSELQSHSDLVCRLLLEKKKKNFLAFLRVGKQKQTLHIFAYLLKSCISTMVFDDFLQFIF